MTGSTPTSVLYDLALYDFEKDELHALLPIDGEIDLPFGWSADGRWLFELRDDMLILTAPEEGYKHLVLHGLHACRGAAWTSLETEP